MCLLKHLLWSPEGTDSCCSAPCQCWKGWWMWIPRREKQNYRVSSLSFTATADIFNILSASCLQCAWWMFWFSALEKKGINREKQLLQLENHWGLECFEWCFSLTMVKLPEQVQKIAAVLRNNPHLINNLISLKALPKNISINRSCRKKMMTR